MTTLFCSLEPLTGAMYLVGCYENFFNREPTVCSWPNANCGREFMRIFIKQLPQKVTYGHCDVRLGIIYQQFANDHNISGGEDLFAYYVKTMVEAVKTTGKKPMIWYVQARMHRCMPEIRASQMLCLWQGPSCDGKTRA